MIAEITDNIREVSFEPPRRVERRPSPDEHEELWLALVVAVVTAGTVAAVHLPAWGEMLAIAVGLYAMCKQVTWWRGTRGGTRGTAWKQLAYLLAWPGMDTRAFLFAKNPRPVRAPEWIWAFGKIACGVALVWGLAHKLGGGAPSAWAAMVGLVMAFHFGMFHVLSLAWRCGSIDARAIMREPWRSRTVAEFWGERWNSAYRDLTHALVFQPATRFVKRITAEGACAPHVAVMAGFLASGLVHELVISVPARAGYGLPTLYFLIQGAAVLAEKRFRVRRARLWTWSIIILPIGILFHPWFVTNVVMPMLEAMGAM